MMMMMMMMMMTTKSLTNRDEIFMVGQNGIWRVLLGHTCLQYSCFCSFVC
jgi:hypothetical protein